MSAALNFGKEHRVRCAHKNDERTNCLDIRDPDLRHPDILLLDIPKALEERVPFSEERGRNQNQIFQKERDRNEIVPFPVPL